MTTFRFTPAEINTIATGLSELPFKTAAPILDSIRDQIQASAARDQRNAQSDSSRGNIFESR